MDSLARRESVDAIPDQHLARSKVDQQTMKELLEKVKLEQVENLMSPALFSMLKANK